MKKWLIYLIKEANDPKTSRKRLIEIANNIADSRDPYAICDFCEWVDRADDEEIMPILQYAIEAINDPVHLYEYAYLMSACDKKFVDYEALQKKIINYGNPKLICYSSEYVYKFDQKELALGMIKHGNEKWLKHYIEAKGYDAGLEDASKDLKDAQKQALLAKLKSEEDKGYYIPKSVTKKFKGKSRADYINAVIESKDPYLINELAENEATLYMLTPNVLSNFIRHFENAQIKTNEMLHIYEFGASVPGADVKMIEDAAINSEMPKYMYYVGAYVPGADCKKMLKGIRECKNVPEFVKQKYEDLLLEHMKEVGSEPGEE